MELERSICEEHAAEAAFLWTQRDRAVLDAAYTRRDIAALDERLEAHIDGLRFAGELGVACSLSAAEDEPGAGEVFVATLVALEQSNWKAMAGVLNLSGVDPSSARGIVSALGWAPPESFAAVLPGFLAERNPPALVFLGVSACAIRRLMPPEPSLTYALASKDARLRARALRAVGELGDRDLIDELRGALADESDDCRFGAAWSGVLLGDPFSLDTLWGFATKGGRRAEAAAFLAARRLDPRHVMGDVQALVQAEEGFRPAFAAAAALGDPALVPWLIDRMADPAMARRATLAISMITGADFEAEELQGKPRAGVSEGPSDAPEDEDVALDPDDGLPFGDVDAAKEWWKREQARFELGRRYLLGRPAADLDWAEQVLEEGHQVARASAAIELLMGRRRKVLPEVRALGWRGQAG